MGNGNEGRKFAKGTVLLITLLLTIFTGLLMAGQVGWISAITLSSYQAGSLLTLTGLILFWEMHKNHRLNIKSIKKNPLNGIEAGIAVIALLIGIGIFTTQTLIIPETFKLITLLIEGIGLAFVFAELVFLK